MESSSATSIDAMGCGIAAISVLIPAIGEISSPTMRPNAPFCSTSVPISADGSTTSTTPASTLRPSTVNCTRVTATPAARRVACNCVRMRESVVSSSAVADG